jgi:nucleoside-diphosphate-sugar epimerase
VDRGLPLPFGSIENRRSLVSVFNLCDLLRICLEHPKACGEVFLIKDGEDLSTAEIIRRIAKAMHRPCRLVRIPAPLLRLAVALVGRRAEADRLCDSLQMDMEKTRVLLNWTPPVSIAEGLERTVEWFLREEKQ